ncbi:MAG: hypothetical protein HFI38_02395 [Lachnospiraceae bacterium]|jgi:hypothetical protein|nr:hypothetical protein [Lachnospiraceae bacterium]
MATFGAKYIVFAPFAEEPKDTLPSYKAAVEVGQLVKADLTVNLTAGELWANNALAEKIEEFASGTLAVEVDDMTHETESALFGSTLKEKELIDSTGDTIPYGGLGYYKTLSRGGKKYYEACFYPKTKAVMGNDTAQSKASSITFTARPLSFTIYEPQTGEWRYREVFDSEEAAVAYIDGKLKTVTGEDVQ